MIHILLHEFFFSDFSFLLQKKKTTFERENYKRNRVQRDAKAKSLEKRRNIQRANEIECNVRQFEMHICVWIMRIIPVQILILEPNNSKPTQNEIHWIDDIKLNISYGNVLLPFHSLRKARFEMWSTSGIGIKWHQMQILPIFPKLTAHTAGEWTEKNEWWRRIHTGKMHNEKGESAREMKKSTQSHAKHRK